MRKTKLPTVQHLIINAQGVLRASDEVLFATQTPHFERIIGVFPFLESVFSQLIGLTPNQPSFVFMGITQPNTVLKGCYDFYFSYILYQNEDCIEWRIEDRTAHYARLSTTQQQAYDTIIAQERNSK